jgi:uncharacterized protein DUF4129
MARRLHQTLADYVVIAISPALIMALVGSLVFFLLKVFYQGQFEARLHWVMACFVFAAVLIGRISIEEGMERASMFGVALAVPVGIAANRFMEFHGGWIEHVAWLINWCLIGVIWWCTHRLVWDCTVIDDAEDASGEGLLQTAGLEPSASNAKPGESSPQPIEGTTSRELPPGWWQRYVEHQRRPHAPGVWVVYFSLAALPLFGVGQWFIRANDLAGRRYAFWLLSVYVGSGMGLLLTTSFLGLRRYLRQRRIEMPTLMANLWMGMGAAVIVVLLVFAALLPRPSAEYEISQLPISLGSPQAGSSKMVPINEEGTHDEQPGPAPERQPPDEPPLDANSTDQNPPPNDPSAAPKDNGTPQPSANPPEPQPSNASGGQKGEGKSREKGQDEKSSKQEKKADNRSQSAQDQPASSEQAKPAPQSDYDKIKKVMEKSQQRQAQQQRDAQRKEEAEQKDKEATEQKESSPQEQQIKQGEKAQQPPEERPPSEAEPAQPDDTSPTLETPKSVVETVAGILSLVFKWAFYAAVILAAAYFLWRWRAEVMAAIREFLAALRDFWNRLWGRQRPQRFDSGDSATIEIPPAPFSTYADPFATGIAARYSTEELVRYSFEAFEAWAREHGCPREPDTTPHELARDVGKRNIRIAADARNLAELYGRVAYAEGEPPSNSNEQLRHLWQSMRSGVASSR